MQQNRAGEPRLFKLFGHFSLILIVSFSALSAKDSFEDFKKSQADSFKSYKDERDNAFNKYLEEQWKGYEAYKGTPLYKEPKPKEIPPAKPMEAKPVGPKITIQIKKIIEPEAVKEPITQPVKEAVKTPSKEISKVLPIVIAEPKIDKKIAEAIKQKDITIEFYGSTLGFNVSKELKKASFYPQNQQGISNFFSAAASSEHQDLVSDVIRTSKEMNLNDWGIYLLVVKLSNAIHKDQDDAKLLSWFLFNKLGFAVKVGFAEKHVVVMHYSKKIIYSTPSYNFGGKKYYVVDNYAKGSVGKLYSYEQDYPGSTKPLNLSLDSLPKFEQKLESKTLSFSQAGKEYKVPYNYNKNLIDFMATYPQADYDTFFNAPVDTATYKALVPALKKYIDGKQASDAMNFVLSFVQKSFVYEQDDQQFGREKVMFAQETLFFSKSDCEDRAILYSYLMKELFNVSIVGVKYDDHMATAIYVPLDGDKVNVEAKQFVVADPTYINANIGMSMPKYKAVKPQSFIFVKKD
ncbi:hypothetical protein [Sulfurimonas sp.]|uniref:hypothetical protein n=1 Tax=Sulfurimonas sp. TaxID=2022749 RepID=UPI0026326BC5|nr:hypothetical protein [Sulfurimonas sp.]MDD5157197.1 hypothetical protein [Sulfurimonas sp.]